MTALLVHNLSGSKPAPQELASVEDRRGLLVPRRRFG
jgi:hypothetical protein